MQEDFKTVDEHLNQDYYLNPNNATMKNVELQQSTTKGFNKLITLMKIKVKNGSNKLQEDDGIS